MTKKEALPEKNSRSVFVLSKAAMRTAFKKRVLTTVRTKVIKESIEAVCEKRKDSVATKKCSAVFLFSRALKWEARLKREC